MAAKAVRSCTMKRCPPSNICSFAPAIREASFRRAVVWLSVSRVAGTALAQAILVPAAAAIAVIARAI